MKHTIQPICLFTEWIHLASRVATNTLAKEVATEIANRYNIDVVQLQETLAPITDFENKLIQSIDTTITDFDFFFYPVRQEETTLAQTFVSLFNDTDNYNKRDFSDISEAQWLNQFTISLSNLLNEDDLDSFKQEHNIHSVSSLLETVIQSNLEESVKYRFIIAASQPLWCIKRLWEMFDIQASLWEKHEKQLNDFAKSKLEYWITQYDSVYDLIQKKVNVKGFAIEDNIDIIPSVFNFNTLTILKKNQFSNEESDPVLHIGPMIFDLTDAIERLPQENDRMLFLMKMLSDKSKFEILRICKDKAMYGQQVANHLKLTTATTSYHLNALVNVGYLSLNVEANRIYYQTQTEKIKQDMQLISSMFE
jgi:regulator of sigma D